MTRIHKPLTLVGMSGVGKSHWSRRLHRDRAHAVHDCDADIAGNLSDLVTPNPGEQPVHALGRWMGMPWSEGYAEREQKYLELEAEVTGQAVDRIAAAAPDTRHVLDTTGSVIYMPPSLLDRIRAISHVIYIQSAPSHSARLLEQYLQTPKPVVWSGGFAPRDDEARDDALARCYRELLAERHTRYAALAHQTVDASWLWRTRPVSRALDFLLGGDQAP